MTFMLPNLNFTEAFGYYDDDDDEMTMTMTMIIMMMILKMTAGIMKMMLIVFL